MLRSPAQNSGDHHTQHHNSVLGRRFQTREGHDICSTDFEDVLLSSSVTVIENSSGVSVIFVKIQFKPVPLLPRLNIMERDDGMVAIVEGRHDCGLTITMTSNRARSLLDGRAHLPHGHRMYGLPKNLKVQRASSSCQHAGSCTRFDKYVKNAYTSSYQEAYSRVIPMASSAVLPEYPVRVGNGSCYRGSHFAVGVQGSRVSRSPPPLNSGGLAIAANSSVEYYENNLPIPYGSRRPCCGAEPFAALLRQYPVEVPEVKGSADLLQRLIAYSQDKSFAKGTCHSKSLRSIRDRRCKELSNKNVQTYTRQTVSLERSVSLKGTESHRPLESPECETPRQPVSPKRSRSKTAIRPIVPRNELRSRSASKRQSVSPRSSVSPKPSTPTKPSVSPRPSVSPKLPLSLRSPVTTRQSESHLQRLNSERLRRESPIRDSNTEKCSHLSGSKGKVPEKYGSREQEGEPNSIYDYLKGSTFGNRSTEVRYLNDVSKYVKDSLKQIYDEPSLPVCPHIRKRYVNHKKHCTKRSIDKWSSVAEDENNETGSGPCRGITKASGSQSLRRRSHSSSPIRKALVNSPCKRILTQNDSNLSCLCEEELNRQIDQIVLQWLKSVPVLALFSSSNKYQMDKSISSLKRNLKDHIVNNDEEAARAEILKRLNSLPLWYGPYDPDTFKAELAEDLLNKFRDLKKPTKVSLADWLRKVPLWYNDEERENFSNTLEMEYKELKAKDENNILNIMKGIICSMICEVLETHSKTMEKSEKNRLVNDIYDKLLQSTDDDEKKNIVNMYEKKIAEAIKGVPELAGQSSEQRLQINKFIKLLAAKLAKTFDFPEEERKKSKMKNEIASSLEGILKIMNQDMTPAAKKKIATQLMGSKTADSLKQDDIVKYVENNLSNVIHTLAEFIIAGINSPEKKRCSPENRIENGMKSDEEIEKVLKDELKDTVQDISALDPKEMTSINNAGLSEMEARVIGDIQTDLVKAFENIPETASTTSEQKKELEKISLKLANEVQMLKEEGLSDDEIKKKFKNNISDAVDGILKDKPDMTFYQKSVNEAVDQLLDQTVKSVNNAESRRKSKTPSTIENDLYKGLEKNPNLANSKHPDKYKCSNYLKGVKELKAQKDGDEETMNKLREEIVEDLDPTTETNILNQILDIPTIDETKNNRNSIDQRRNSSRRVSIAIPELAAYNPEVREIVKEASRKLEHRYQELMDTDLSPDEIKKQLHDDAKKALEEIVGNKDESLDPETKNEIVEVVLNQVVCPEVTSEVGNTFAEGVETQFAKEVQSLLEDIPELKTKSNTERKENDELIAKLIDKFTQLQDSNLSDKDKQKIMREYIQAELEGNAKKKGYYIKHININPIATNILKKMLEFFDFRDDISSSKEDSSDKSDIKTSADILKLMKAIHADLKSQNGTAATMKKIMLIETRILIDAFLEQRSEALDDKVKNNLAKVLFNKFMSQEQEKKTIPTKTLADLTNNLAEYSVFSENNMTRKNNRSIKKMRDKKHDNFFYYQLSRDIINGLLEYYSECLRPGAKERIVENLVEEICEIYDKEKKEHEKEVDFLFDDLLSSSDSADDFDNKSRKRINRQIAAWFRNAQLKTRNSPEQRVIERLSQNLQRLKKRDLSPEELRIQIAREIRYFLEDIAEMTGECVELMQKDKLIQKLLTDSNIEISKVSALNDSNHNLKSTSYGKKKLYNEDIESCHSENRKSKQQTNSAERSEYYYNGRSLKLHKVESKCPITFRKIKSNTKKTKHFTQSISVDKMKQKSKKKKKMPIKQYASATKIWSENKVLNHTERESIDSQEEFAKLFDNYVDYDLFDQTKIINNERDVWEDTFISCPSGKKTKNNEPGQTKNDSNNTKILPQNCQNDQNKNVCIHTYDKSEKVETAVFSNEKSDLGLKENVEDQVRIDTKRKSSHVYYVNKPTTSKKGSKNAPNKGSSPVSTKRNSGRVSIGKSDANTINKKNGSGKKPVESQLHNILAETAELTGSEADNLISNILYKSTKLEEDEKLMIRDNLVDNIKEILNKGSVTDYRVYLENSLEQLLTNEVMLGAVNAVTKNKINAVLEKGHVPNEVKDQIKNILFDTASKISAQVREKLFQKHNQVRQSTSSGSRQSQEVEKVFQKLEHGGPSTSFGPRQSQEAKKIFQKLEHVHPSTSSSPRQSQEAEKVFQKLEHGGPSTSSGPRQSQEAKKVFQKLEHVHPSTSSGPRQSQEAEKVFQKPEHGGPSTSSGPRQSQEAEKVFQKLEHVGASTSSGARQSQEVEQARLREIEYTAKVEDVIKNWLSNLSIDPQVFQDSDFKNTIIRDLAGDIVDRQKYYQVHPENKPSAKEELEQLKYEIFRWLNKFLESKDLEESLNKADDLMDTVRCLSVPSLVVGSIPKFSDALLNEIAAFIDKKPPSSLAVNKSKLRDAIKDLVRKIDNVKDEPDVDSKIGTQISMWLPNVFPKLPRTELSNMGKQLLQTLKEKGFTDNTWILSLDPSKFLEENLNSALVAWLKSTPLYLSKPPLEKKEMENTVNVLGNQLKQTIKSALDASPYHFDIDQILLEEINKHLENVIRDPTLITDSNFVHKSAEIILDYLKAQQMFQSISQRTDGPGELLEAVIANWVSSIPIQGSDPIEEKQLEAAEREFAYRLKQARLQYHPNSPQHEKYVKEQVKSFLQSIIIDSCVRFDENFLNDKAEEFVKLLKVVPIDQVRPIEGLSEDRKDVSRAFKPPADILYDDIASWCEDLPIYCGDALEDIENAQLIKQNLSCKLINKIGTLNLNPDIFKDDYLYEQILLDELDIMFRDVPKSSELVKYLPALKRHLVAKVKDARNRICHELEAMNYKRQLRDAIDMTIHFPGGLTSEEFATFELFKETIPEAFINLIFSPDNDDIRCRFVKKISDDIDKLCNDYIRNRGIGCCFNTAKIKADIHKVLKSVKVPSDESMRTEVEKLRIKDIIDNWLKLIPFRDDTASERLNRNKVTSILAKRIHEMEKEKESNPYYDSYSIILDEIVRYLGKMSLIPGAESAIPNLAERLKSTLQISAHFRKFDSRKRLFPSDSQSTNCRYTSSLTSADKDHLQRIKDRMGKIPSYKDACLGPSPIDEGSQTDVRPCPNQVKICNKSMGIQCWSSFTPSAHSSRLPDYSAMLPQTFTKTSNSTVCNLPRSPCASSTRYSCTTAGPTSKCFIHSELRSSMKRPSAEISPKIIIKEYAWEESYPSENQVASTSLDRQQASQNRTSTTSPCVSSLRALDPCACRARLRRYTPDQNPSTISEASSADEACPGPSDMYTPRVVNVNSNNSCDEAPQPLYPYSATRPKPKKSKPRRKLRSEESCSTIDGYGFESHDTCYRHRGKPDWSERLKERSRCKCKERVLISSKGNSDFLREACRPCGVSCPHPTNLYFRK